MLSSYYEMIARDDFGNAYALRSARSHNITSLSTFEKTWQSNQGIEIRNSQVLSNNEGVARLRMQILFEEESGPVLCDATIDLIFEDRSWRYDGGDFARVKPEPIQIEQPTGPFLASGPKWHRLRIGMTKPAVEEFMGHPDRASLLRWDYGSGLSVPYISFDMSGSVVGWDKPAKLKRSRSAVDNLPWDSLRAGLDKGEVEQLMGHPDGASLLRWDYGSGLSVPYISFDMNGSVDGWEKP